MQSALPSSIKSAADLNLERRVALTLAGLHVPLLRFLHVEVSDGTVTLSGRVGSYYERQLAQSRARRVAGVVRLIDALTVVQRPSSRPGGFSALLTRPISGLTSNGIPASGQSLAAVARSDSGHSPAASPLRRTA